MENVEWILADDCCRQYKLDQSFIIWLSDHELLQVESHEEQLYIPGHQLPRLEQFIRLYYDLEINLEGIEAISHLLMRVEKMQKELTHLNNQLSLYRHLYELE